MLIILGLIISCKYNASNTEEIIIKFDKTLYDFGKMPINSGKSTLFTFTNMSNNPLTIKDAKTSCSCTSAEYERGTIKPNEQGTVKVTYNSNEQEGPFINTIDVHFNLEGDPQVLMVKGDVIISNE